jgi:hypothetical protein
VARHAVEERCACKRVSIVDTLGWQEERRCHPRSRSNIE